MRAFIGCTFVAAAVLALAAFSVQAAQHVAVSAFATDGLKGWETRSFQGRTEYKVVDTQHGAAVRATSDGTASGLYRKVDVDLQKTPYLHWSWKVSHSLKGLRERTKAGDDYAARVYVVFPGGLAFWRTVALNYVWSGSQAVGTWWRNAFTDHAAMLAVESGDAKAGQWVSERRNILDDYRKAFGDEAPAPGAVAIMTDTDNADGSATAWYADIYFSSK